MAAETGDLKESAAMREKEAEAANSARSATPEAGSADDHLIQELGGEGSKELSTKEVNEDGATPARVQTRVYSKRWVVLILFVCYSMSNAFQWIQYSIVGNIVMEYYGVSQEMVDMTSYIYMFVYIPLIFPATYLLEEKWRSSSGALNWFQNGRLKYPIVQIGYGSSGSRTVLQAVALSLAWPMTVSAWSFSKSEPAIPLRNSKDKELLKDLEAADEMYKSGEMSRNEDVLNKLLVHKDKNEPELQWRLSRAIYEKSKGAKDNEKKTLVELAYATVQKALVLEDNCFGAHKWKAIILNEYSSLQGTKEKIMESYNIKFHMERALELNPNDPTTWYLLGQWCYSVADIPWYQRKIAAAVFSTPPSSTFEEALEKFQRAEDIQPLFYSMNLLMLVKTHLKLGNHQKASEYLEKLATLQMKTEEDFTARKEASELRHQIRL